jgi:hypothetical protein
MNEFVSKKLLLQTSWTLLMASARVLIDITAGTLVLEVVEFGKESSFPDL